MRFAFDKMVTIKAPVYEGIYTLDTSCMAASLLLGQIPCSMDQVGPLKAPVVLRSLVWGSQTLIKKGPVSLHRQVPTESRGQRVSMALSPHMSLLISQGRAQVPVEGPALVTMVTHSFGQHFYQLNRLLLELSRAMFQNTYKHQTKNKIT